MKYLFCFVLALLAHQLSAAAQPIEMFKFIYGQETQARCATAEGREQILANLPTSEQQGLRNQELGLAMQEGREPDIDGYMRNKIQENCNRALGLDSSPPLYVFDFSRGNSIIFWTYVECKSSWDDRCSDTVEVKGLSPSMQACRAVYDVTHRKGEEQGFEFKPILPVRDEPGLEHRFQGYSLKFWAHGNGRLLAPEGARIKLSNIGIFVLGIEATKAERDAAGCDLYPSSPPAVPRTPSTPQPSKIIVSWKPGTPQSNQLRYLVDHVSGPPGDVCLTAWTEHLSSTNVVITQIKYEARITMMPNTHIQYDIPNYNRSWKYRDTRC